MVRDQIGDEFDECAMANLSRLLLLLRRRSVERLRIRSRRIVDVFIPVKSILSFIRLRLTDIYVWNESYN